MLFGGSGLSSSTCTSLTSLSEADRLVKGNFDPAQCPEAAFQLASMLHEVRYAVIIVSKPERLAAGWWRCYV